MSVLDRFYTRLDAEPAHATSLKVGAIPNDWIMDGINDLFNGRTRWFLGRDVDYWADIMLDAVAQANASEFRNLMFELIKGDCHRTTKAIKAELVEYANSVINKAPAWQLEQWGINPGKPYEFEGWQRGE